jgi:hypothetical protein
MVSGVTTKRENRLTAGTMNERRRLREPLFGYNPNAMNKERAIVSPTRNKRAA